VSPGTASATDPQGTLSPIETVLRASSDDRAQLPAVVAEQVARMDDIVGHQLARAVAGSGATFAAALPLAPLIERIRASLAKVYADKGIALRVVASPGCPGGWTRAMRTSC
jgi:hypothetical protein